MFVVLPATTLFAGLAMQGGITECLTVNKKKEGLGGVGGVKGDEMHWKCYF